MTTKMYWAQLGPFRRLIAVRKGAELHYLHHDHLGSTKTISGTTGGPMKYYPFGSAYQEISNPPTDNLYTGQKRDASTGLHYLGARYTNPTIGMFIQPDTFAPAPGNPQTLNRYAYALNNPMRYTDPTGHRPELSGPDLDLWYAARGYEPDPDSPGGYKKTGRYNAVVRNKREALIATQGAKRTLIMVGGVGTGGVEHGLDQYAARVQQVSGLSDEEFAAVHIAYDGGWGIMDWAFLNIPTFSYDTVARNGVAVLLDVAEAVFDSGSSVMAIGHSRGADVVSRAVSGRGSRWISRSVGLNEPLTLIPNGNPSTHLVLNVKDDPVSSWSPWEDMMKGFSRGYSDPTAGAKAVWRSVDATVGSSSRRIGHGALLYDQSQTDPVASFLLQ